MEKFEAQQFRDKLAKEIKETSKEERKDILEKAKEMPEYQQARTEKIDGVRNVEQDRLAFVEAIKNIETDEIDTEFDERSVESLVSELGKAKLLLLGETHGVKENADIIYTLFKKFGFKKLALEWDKKLKAQAEKFLAIGELDFETIKDSPDGRITAGHFALLKKLKDEGLLEALVCFDSETPYVDWDTHDANMAKNILANVSDGPTLVVAGTWHTKVTPVIFEGETKENHPMGENVKKLIPDVPSGKIEYLTGQFHNFGTKDFEEKPEGVDLPKARFYKSDDGIYVFELPEAHVAIVPNPSEVLSNEENENQTEMLESVLGSIMTAEEYSKIEHATPYVFELKAGGKELYYFGSPHTSDPNNPLFAEIEAAFNKANPDIVFVEGMNVRGDKTEFNKRIKSATREEAIESMGESGLTLKLAVEKGIEWESPEPSDEDLHNNLLGKGFSKDQIFAQDVFLMLPQYNRQMKREGFEKYVSRYIERFKRTTNWEGFDYSYERAIKLGEQICGESIDVENDDSAPDRVDPIPWEEMKGKQTILNRVSEASSLFRDKKIVSDILEALKTHNRVFVVYGASHASMQEPAFKKAFESA